MSARNRAAGWQHAKLSGHQNENNIEQLLMNSPDVASSFLRRIGLSGLSIRSVKCGGLTEGNVPSVLDTLTKSKSDIYLTLSNLEEVRISLKKSAGGQVYLVTTENFMNAYEKHYETIPDNVKRAIGLYWGSDPDIVDIINKYSTRYKEYELRKNRLVAETLKAYDSDLAKVLLDWFKFNIGNIADMCFSKGAAMRPTDWAQYVWYRNEVGEGVFDEVFSISALSKRCQDNRHLIEFGSKNGGTTIQLPFGFVQWHSPRKVIPGCMQFHHGLCSINSMF